MTQMAQYQKGGFPQYVDYTPVADVAVGDVVVSGDTLLICTGGVLSNGAGTGISSGKLGAMVARGGIFLCVASGIIPKRSRVYWDASVGKVTQTAAGNHRFGVTCDTQSADGDTIPVEFAPEAVPINYTNGMRMVRGHSTTVAASDTIVTGLATVVAVVASLDDDPVLTCDRATASIGDQAGAPAAGSFLLKTWMPTGLNNTTPIAATTFGKKVNWIAIGT